MPKNPANAIGIVPVMSLSDKASSTIVFNQKECMCVHAHVCVCIMKRLQSHVRYIGQELDGAGGPATFLFISHSIEHSHTLLRTGTVSKAPVNPFVSNLTATDGPNGVSVCVTFLGLGVVVRSKEKVVSIWNWVNVKMNDRKLQKRKPAGYSRSDSVNGMTLPISPVKRLPSIAIVSRRFMVSKRFSTLPSRRF